MQPIMQQVDIIGVQVDLGASKRGVNMGPLAIRYADICNELLALGLHFVDKGDLLPGAPHPSKTRMKNARQIHELNARLFAAVRDTLQAGAFPLVLGGDHSVAAGSIPATAGHYKDIGVIWLDAHGDFNDPDSSRSGNVHGMPFSAVCGFGPNCLVDFGEDAGMVDPQKAVLLGARDIDASEKARLKRAGVTVFSMTDVDKLGMPQVMERAIDIATNGTRGFHVSYDIDVVTPQEAPGVGTPVHSGLTVREAFLAAEMIAESGRALSMDMVEVNPILDYENRTGKLACQLILSVLGKRLY